MARADNRGRAGIPGSVLGLFAAGNLLVVVIGLQALFGAGVLEALTRLRARRPHDEPMVGVRVRLRLSDGRWSFRHPYIHVNGRVEIGFSRDLHAPTTGAG